MLVWALLYALFFLLAVATQLRVYTVQQRLWPQVVANRSLLYAANRSAIAYSNLHIDDANNALVSQHQTSLNAEVNRLNAQQMALLSTSVRAARWQPIWSRLQFMMIIPPVAIFLWQFWQARRIRERRRKNQCAGCGYDLMGNLSGVCPECGTLIAAVPPMT